MKKGILLALALILVGLGAVGTVTAAKNNKETVPGWGYGDKNHVHTGPPGQSVRPR